MSTCLAIRHLNIEIKVHDHKRVLIEDLSLDLNKGEISVTSKEGVGSTFIVSLPRSNSAHQALSLETSQQEFSE